MKKILTLLTLLTVCSATAQTKVTALIESDTPYTCEIYAQVNDTTMEWMAYEIWPYYNEMSLTVRTPGDDMLVRFTRHPQSTCADTTYVTVAYNPEKTKIDTTIVLNGGQYFLK